MLDSGPKLMNVHTTCLMIDTPLYHGFHYSAGQNANIVGTVCIILGKVSVHYVVVEARQFR